MFRILQNAYINRGKREKAAPAATDPFTLEASAPAPVLPALTDLRQIAAVSDEHFDERVKAALERLPDTYRVPMVLFSLGELSYQEIADTLSIPIGTVMSRLHRARTHLKAELAEYAKAERFAAEGK